MKDKIWTVIIGLLLALLCGAIGGVVANTMRRERPTTPVVGMGIYRSGAEHWTLLARTADGKEWEIRNAERLVCGATLVLTRD